MTDVIDDLASEEEEITAEEVEEVEETTETEETAQEEEKEDDKDTRTVPLAALWEERDKRRDLQRQVEDGARKVQSMEELFKRFQQETLGAKGEHVPKYEDDPEGHLRGTIAELQKRLDGFEQKTNEQTEQSKAHAQQQQLLEQYAADVRTFSAGHSDFQDAYNWLAAHMDEDLKARGYDDSQERRNILQFEEGKIVGRALMTGKSPAELIYNYAKARGYMNGKGEDDKLERLKKGADASRTLGNVKGKGEGSTTLERLAELADTDPEAFDREWKKAQQKGLLG